MSASEVDRKLEVLYVPVAKIHPNPWNPNQMDARTYEATKESLATYGFVAPVAVRAHPSIDGEWEVVDGEHRLRLAVEADWAEVPVIPLDGLSEDDAKKLTIILNETRGQADTVPLARLLAELQKDTTLDELLNGLPYERAQLEELLKIGQIDWGAFEAERSDEVENHLRLAREKNQFTVFLNFDKGQKEKYDTFTDMLARENGAEYTAEQAVIDGLGAICQKL